MPGIEPQDLVTPKAPSGTTNSIQCTDLTSSSQPDFFAYVGDNSSTCLSGAACLTFKFKYKDEATGQIDTINSLHQATIAVSGTPVISSSADSSNGFTQINSNWTAVNSAVSYDLQSSTTSDFTGNLVTQTTTSLSGTSTGLNYNTTYYFRVRANSVTGSGAWSSSAIASTWSIVAPTTSVSTVSSTSYNQTWNSTLHASSYVAQCSTDGTTWGTGCQASTSATSFTYTGASQGTRYYVRVQAINGPYTSAWSNIANTITKIDSPAPYSVSYGNTSATWNWLTATSNAICPPGTTPSYDWYHDANVFWVSGTQYKTVNWQYSNWGQSVTLNVASRCITSIASSSFVWGSNSASGSLNYPTVWIVNDAWRTVDWGGTCPQYTTSANYDYVVHGNSGTWNATAGSVSYTQYYNPNIVWGDGDARAAIHCVGPWGSIQDAGDAWVDFGSGCIPTITSSWCTY